MLLRIAPDMFTDDRYHCVTVLEVRKEIFGKQKFKSKYPWRDQFKNKIKVAAYDNTKVEDIDFNFELIKQIVDSAKINAKTGRTFGLSHVDQRIIAYSLVYDLNISSTDNELVDFIEQEFDKINKSPLAILNEWIKSGLIEWNSNLQTIIIDWENSGEPVQPKKDIKEFERITGRKYLGP